MELNLFQVVYQPGGYSSLSLADGSEDDRFSHKEPKPFPSYDSKHSSPPSKPSFTNPHTSNPILGSEYTKPSSIFGPPQHPVSQSVPKPHPYSQALSSQDNPLTQGANKFDIYPQPKKSLPQFTQPHSHAQAPGYGHHVPAYGDHAAYGAHPGYGARAGPAPSLTSSGVYGAIPQSYGPASGAGAGAGAGVGERSYPGTYPHSHAKIAPSGAAIHYPHQQPPPPQPKTDPTVHTSVKIHHPPGGASSITF